jgi:hypothetical protein
VRKTSVFSLVGFEPNAPQRRWVACLGVEGNERHAPALPPKRTDSGTYVIARGAEE